MGHWLDADEATRVAAKAFSENARIELAKLQTASTIFMLDCEQEPLDMSALIEKAGRRESFPGSLPSGPSPVKVRPAKCRLLNLAKASNDINGQPTKRRQVAPIGDQAPEP